MPNDGYLYVSHSEQ